MIIAVDFDGTCVTHEFPEVADKYNVKGLPTILLLNDKEEVLETWHGIVKSEVINSKIKEYETD